MTVQLSNFSSHTTKGIHQGAQGVQAVQAVQAVRAVVAVEGAKTATRLRLIQQEKEQL